MRFKYGHTPKTKLPDVVAACNMIKSQRKQQKKNRYKTIRLDFENNEELYIETTITIRLTTGNINVAHSLRYKGIHFYPTTKKRLKCTNQHAIEQLNHRREYSKKNRRRWR